MRRRDFILSSASLVAAASRAQGQSQAVPEIGFLRTTTQEASAHLISAFERGMADAGFALDKSYRMLFRFADGKPDRLAGLAKELVEAGSAVLVGNGISARALMAATARIPIVFVTGSDPVRFGLVAAINRPGGNVTGVSFDPASATLEPKRLELLHAVVSGPGRLAALTDPSNPTVQFRHAELRKAALALGRDIVFAAATSPDEIDAAFESFVKQDVKGVLIGGGPHFIGYRGRLARAAAEHRLPSIFVQREFARSGGLMSYGASQPAAYRQAGGYVARVLRGENASELPVLQASTFELVLNLRTAKALGVEFPTTLLATADEVIE
jgi:putative ABC transport system substrate-binding protein